MSMMTETTVYETVEKRNMTCSVHHLHENVSVVREYTLAVVEQREVPNNYLRAYGRVGATGTGYRAVDQFGDEWFSSWEADNTDGMYGGRSWTTEDGRSATDHLNTYSGWVFAEG